MKQATYMNTTLKVCNAVVKKIHILGWSIAFLSNADSERFNGDVSKKLERTLSFCCIFLLLFCEKFPFFFYDRNCNINQTGRLIVCHMKTYCFLKVAKMLFCNAFQPN